ncbi:hypothetical protein H1R20_g3439, partial [Candolleomyces eurysporus]
MVKGEDPAPSTSQPKKKRNDEDPMSPDAGTRPIQLQRRRVWRACESCRRKKIKCDGCEPTCSQCTASGSQCTWLQTKDRAALSRHYVQELEARLLHMESLFQQIAPTLQTMGQPINGLGPLPATTSVSAAEAVSPTTTTPPQPTVNVEPDSSIVDDDFSESFGQLALDEYGHMRWIGGSSTMSLIQSFKALTTSPLHRISPMEEDPQAPGPSVNKLYFPAAIFFGKVDALPGPEEVEYPERDLADRLVEAYFSRLHYLMPVLDKPSFIAKYNQLMDNTRNPSWARNETPFLSLVFAVFACAASLVQDSRLAVSGREDDGGMGMVYYERALILQYISHANIQMAHVQCFILMSSFLCSINCLPQAWILIGQAVRNGQDLGLHRSPRRLNIPNVEKETRKKVWWGVYTLDRMLALALGRPLGINDSDCDVEMPSDVDDEHLTEYFNGAQLPQPSLMAGFIYMIKLYEIGGRMLRQVYALDVCREHLEPEKKAELQRTVENLDNELTKWCNELPAVYKTQPQKDEQASIGIVLCSHYYSVVTTLHRNFLPVKRDDSVTAKSTLKAVSTARHCIKLAPSFQTLVAPSHHLAFFIQNLFSSAVIVLLFAMHTTDARGAAITLEEARGTLTALETWEGQWPGARKCKELLIELVNTATEAIAKHQKDGSNPAPPASPPSRHERRRSVTIGGASSSLPPGRVVKPRTRRNQSRDPGTTSSRRMAAVSPYRVDTAQRARSTSRRRGFDETETGERPPGHIYQSFPSPSSVRNGSSPHSSPGSVNLPSPAMTVLEQTGQQPSQQQQQPAQEPSPPPNSAYSYQSPVSPNQPSPPRIYDYNNYGIQPSALTQESTQQWTNGSDYTANSQDQTLFTNPYGAYPQLDASGLPFRGLDYIRNFNMGGYSTDQDSLWQSYDPNGSFGYDPDLTFNLGDNSTSLQDNIEDKFSPFAKETLAKLVKFLEEEVAPAQKLAHLQLPEDPEKRWKTVLPIVAELKEKAKKLGLWNLFLSKAHYPEFGVPLTNLEYAVMAELLGQSGHFASESVNCSAPDTGNMEVLARYGSPEQQKKWLLPLLNGEIRSAFAMTEKNVASSDATNIRTSIRREGDEIVINGHKWWISGAGDPRCAVHLVLGKSDPNNKDKYNQQSIVLVPANTPGVNIIRPMKVFGYDDAPEGHCEIIYDNVRVPLSNLVLGWGRGFEIIQGRLGPGRIHHCMRSIGAAQASLDLMLQRVTDPTRKTFGKYLYEHGTVVADIAKSRAEIESARLLVLSAALQIDKYKAKGALKEIGIAKFVVPSMALTVIDRAIQSFGAEGLSQDTELAERWANLRTLRFADGPDAVHIQQVGQRELKRVPLLVERTRKMKLKEKALLEKAGLKAHL